MAQMLLDSPIRHNTWTPSKWTAAITYLSLNTPVIFISLPVEMFAVKKDPFTLHFSQKRWQVYSQYVHIHIFLLPHLWKKAVYLENTASISSTDLVSHTQDVYCFVLWYIVMLYYCRIFILQYKDPWSECFDLVLYK